MSIWIKMAKPVPFQKKILLYLAYSVCDCISTGSEGVASCSAYYSRKVLLKFIGSVAKKTAAVPEISFVMPIAAIAIPRLLKETEFDRHFRPKTGKGFEQPLTAPKMSIVPSNHVAQGKHRQQNKDWN